jgi:hypothetical protein
MKTKIQINVDGISEIHIAYTREGYDTLCGVDGGDESIGHFIEDESPKGKVSCAACERIATEGRRWKASDFKTTEPRER